MSGKSKKSALTLAPEELEQLKYLKISLNMGSTSSRKCGRNKTNKEILVLCIRLSFFLQNRQSSCGEYRNCYPVL
jgi:hypothetical protein